MSASFIAVDWGSTNLRAKLVIGGRMAAMVETPEGIRHREGRAFDALLTAACGFWRHSHPDARVLMSGMIGSREGWVEAPYAPAPAGITDLADRVVTVSSPTFGEIAVVPGVRWENLAQNTTDVMRGEETQIAGLLGDLPPAGTVVCLPGTHSKWVVCRHGRIERFRTWLTGEAFDLLTRGSLISGTGGVADPESPAFARGLELSDGGGGLLHHLFLGRTEMLTDRVAATDLRSLISGLLIGHEIREARHFSADLPVYLSGDSPAAAATARALGALGIPFERIAGDPHLTGLLAIAGMMA